MRARARRTFSGCGNTVGHMPGVHVNDFSDYYTQLAIQGPRAAETLQKLTSTDLSTIKNYWFTWGQVCGLHNVMIARTGYTGEDGFEIYIPSDEPTSAQVWGEVLAAGRSLGFCRAGSAREIRYGWRRRWRCMGMRSRTRSTCLRLGWAGMRSSTRADFVGREALVKIQAEGGPKRKLVGLEMIERGIGRDGYPVFALDGRRSARLPAVRRRPF